MYIPLLYELSKCTDKDARNDQSSQTASYREVASVQYTIAE